MQPTTRRRSGGARILRLYGPIAVVVVVAIVVIAVASGGGGNKGTGGGVSTSGSVASFNDKLVRSGPMTPQKAKLLGERVDFGLNCDTTTGRINVPSIYAPPCVAPFRGDNGGATADGVTRDTINVVAYIAPPNLDPLQAAQISGAGANLSPDAAFRTYQGYVDYFNAHFETYGRKVALRLYTATGSATDSEKAKSDAIAIASMNPKPFAVLGGPSQTQAFMDELAARHILCVGTCGLAVPEAFSHARQPYIWPVGQSPEQAARLTAEMIGKGFKAGPARFAGDPALQRKPRVFGILHYDTPDGQQRRGYLTLKKGLASYGIRTKGDTEFFLDISKAQETARTVVTKLKSAGVTTVIFTGDPLMPTYFTREATAQNYFPEWIIGPTVLVDSTFFARTYDQRQWAHAFGISLGAARADPKQGEAYTIYRWQLGQEPPSNTYPVIYPNPRILFTGVQLAGPRLTPETFRDGLFRYPVTGGGPTTITMSWGRHGIWPGLDLNETDDATMLWWNPEVSGDNEIGQPGKGLYEYVKGGKRYRIGQWPTNATGLFDPSTSVTIYSSRPAQDTPPSYPPPAPR